MPSIISNQTIDVEAAGCKPLQVTQHMQRTIATIFVHGCSQCSPPTRRVDLTKQKSQTTYQTLQQHQLQHKTAKHSCKNQKAAYRKLNRFTPLLLNLKV